MQAIRLPDAALRSSQGQDFLESVGGVLTGYLLKCHRQNFLSSSLTPFYGEGTTRPQGNNGNRLCMARLGGFQPVSCRATPSVGSTVKQRARAALRLPELGFDLIVFSRATL